VSDVVDSGWITMADRVRDFERAFAEKHMMAAHAGKGLLRMVR
jgi:dTDP-4-amino-4,6-dideoxygalactose transaminase